ncbi:hypothetical protein BCR34DRAFT_602489 [Clohesyomyces aquaticus]|uniref:Ubiquitin-like domain-containing protein n=1 Tax=Clohesyomyces aquaticus TaxID=1231657 RepID=A0A1Y1ZI30_9PLEO|nr:hypothetical protein BCR34DRAFT_602489 [Clohesyomyces aquaticus]
MPVPFGFSAGDIAIAIQLLIKVCDGLKDTGGATSEYQDISECLRGIILTLQHLQTLRSTCSDPSIVNAIQTMSEAALKPVFEFLEDVKKYDAALRPNSTTCRLRSMYRKTEWTLRIPQKVAKLRARMASEMEPLHLLMESETLKSYNMTTRQISSFQKEFSNQALEQLQFNSTILHAISDLKSSILPKLSPPASQTQRTSEVAVKDGSDERSIVSQVTSKYSFTVSRVNQLREWQIVGQQLAAILIHIFIKLQKFTKYLLIMSPQLLMFLRASLSSIPRGARLLIQDDIHFEDVLGRVEKLPYEYFHVWEVFQAHLHHKFKDRPGETYVKRGDFHILNVFHDRTIRKSSTDWSLAVLPGIRVAMSVIMHPTRALSSCPRCGSRLGRPKDEQVKQCCPNAQCHWERFFNAPDEPVDIGPASNDLPTPELKSVPREATLAPALDSSSNSR